MANKYILFVCGHNSGRSQMAEVYFNIYNKNPDIEARSAWTAIKWDGKINPRVVTLLDDNGIDIFNQDKIYQPKKVTEEMIEWALEVYTMWCMDGCMVWERKIDYDFSLDDPARDDTDVNAMFEDFKKKIDPILRKFNT
jgi:arsenate reductase